MQAANLTLMERIPRGGRRRGGMTPLLSAGLALLVAGTLVTFSVLALRTGFADSSRRGVATHGADPTDGAPVVLPSSSPGSRKRAARNPERDTTETQVADVGAPTETVLGTRLRRDDTNAARTTDITRETTGTDYRDGSDGTDDGSTSDDEGKGRHGHRRGGRAHGRYKHDHYKHGDHEHGDHEHGDHKHGHQHRKGKGPRHHNHPRP